ncbi:F0F1 ATP synthase subunit B [Bartonella apihabitans]|nr:F0F1 ATP synthase subunit B [Bartonella apihabitans]WLT09782.1 F0F1 ATP synthase subunit B [Bartonella apihabitans]
MTDTFWALIGLLLFIAVLVYYKVPALLNSFLDKRAELIRSELDEARRTREEAQELLAVYQAKREQAEKEAKEIIAAAKREAELLAKDAHQKMADYVARRNKMAEQKIAHAELEAIDAVKASVVDIAVAAAKEMLVKEIDDKKSASLIKDLLADVKAHLN